VPDFILARTPLAALPVSYSEVSGPLGRQDTVSSAEVIGAILNHEQDQKAERSRFSVSTVGTEAAGSLFHTLPGPTAEDPRIIAGTALQRNAWYLQTSATHHLTPRRSALTDYEPVDPFLLTVGGATYEAVGRGNLVILWETGSDHARRVTMRGVFYCPEAPACILSLAQLSERGISFTFQKGQCILEQKDGTIAGRAIREGGAYRLLTKRPLE